MIVASQLKSVNGDPVAMRRGDFLPQAGWNWHGHHNVSDRPTAWIDGLDIPFQHYTESTFFEFGPDEVDARQAPERSRSERLWGHPGLRPLTHLQPTPATPLLAYRWEHTDRALNEQLTLESRPPDVGAKCPRGPSSSQRYLRAKHLFTPLRQLAMIRAALRQFCRPADEQSAVTCTDAPLHQEVRNRISLYR